MNVNAARYVQSLHDLGYNRRDIEGHLLRRFPGLNGQQARAVIDRADRARAAAGVFNLGHAGGPLQAREVLRPDPGCTQWRYTTHVSYLTSGGVGGIIPVTRQYTTSQNRAQVLSDASAWAATYVQAMGAAGNPNYPVTGTVSIINAGVTSVERACP